jgi:hypothetical protein
VLFLFNYLVSRASAAVREKFSKAYPKKEVESKNSSPNNNKTSGQRKCLQQET